MLCHGHFLLKAKETDMFEIVLVTESDLIFDSSGTRTDQNVSHQSIEPTPLEMELSKRLGFLFKNDLLRVGLSGLPLSLHFFNL